VVDCLPSKHEALSSNPSTITTKKKKEQNPYTMKDGLAVIVMATINKQKMSRVVENVEKLEPWALPGM
jgi:hypothetical protein